MKVSVLPPIAKARVPATEAGAPPATISTRLSPPPTSGGKKTLVGGAGNNLPSPAQLREMTGMDIPKLTPESIRRYLGGL